MTGRRNHVTFPEMRPWVEPAPLTGTCQYPIGEPGHPDFHFCGNPTHAGRSYCYEHWLVCYRPAPKPRPTGMENIGDPLHLPRRVAS
jgi:hypothetical protein